MLSSPGLGTTHQSGISGCRAVAQTGVICPGANGQNDMVQKARRLPGYGGTKTRHAATFKQRYEEAERRRAAVMQRLAGLNEKARAHPGYRRASTLLNQTFRKASVAQRLATLQAAEWLIEVLENLSMFM